ncbi:lipid-transfer protein [Nocardioides marmorisolisilvae]|uniref:Lipid-transfer protein n=1 Tax=Nocardioides marmorisolisilvae TaxID=1542737 RepID=A0A3N0DV93_9ACTN|nr:lipid-transfer protein [Nocardioides marmorisolisilvae]RNL79530.1 lipid-transfer protein [Nocardioides marmorisolisilvae]
MSALSGKAAIVGIGATEFSKESGRSELQLSVQAVRAALADCGLTAADVDGLTTFTMDTSSEIAVARELGVPSLRFFSRINYGGGAACGTVQQAAMAVATGVADVVVCYRGFNERSESRFGQFSLSAATQVNTNGLDNAWSYPMGLGTPAATVAMQARRYMHEYGATSEDFGAVAVADRRHAATNPNAFFYGKPITLEDHQASRMIVDPLHLLDCCQESDGAVAIVVVSAERAKDLPQKPAYITAAAQGSGRDQYVMTSYYRDDIGIPEMGVVGTELWRQSGLGPDDMRMGILYDHFTPYVLMQLEELGFCKPGEAKDFVKDGAIEVDGRFPLNTHGGQLGEAYIHGMNGIAEGVRQIRGTSVNPVADVQHLVVTAGTGVPTSGLILSA